MYIINVKMTEKSPSILESMHITAGTHCQSYAATYECPKDVSIDHVDENTLRTALASQYNGGQTAYQEIFAILNHLVGDIKIVTIATHEKVYLITQWRSYDMIASPHDPNTVTRQFSNIQIAFTIADSSAILPPKDKYLPADCRVKVYARGFRVEA